MNVALPPDRLDSVAQFIDELWTDRLARLKRAVEHAS
jgi:hypothetical protein